MMKPDTLKALDILRAEDCTCVVCREKSVFVSRERGIKPLVNWLDGGESFASFCAADKIVGRAAAFLYILLGVDEVYADVMSKKAEKLLAEHGISAYFNTSTDKIINREGTDICPMEKAVTDIDDPNEAFSALRIKMSELQKHKITHISYK